MARWQGSMTQAVRLSEFPVALFLDRLERALIRHLGHPVPAEAPPPPRTCPGAPPRPAGLFDPSQLAALRQALESLRAAGEAIGAVPPGYPWWAVAIIRAVAALLPWYTRPLRRYAALSSDILGGALALMSEAESRARAFPTEAAR
jgi:hypothetical protein